MAEGTIFEESPRKRPRLADTEDKGIEEELPGPHPAKSAKLGPEYDGANDTPDPPPANGAVFNDDAGALTQEQLENKVHITAFAPAASGFTGILKQRYTDFLVNEILPNGEVLHLLAEKPKEKRRKPDKDGEAEPVGATDSLTFTVGGTEGQDGESFRVKSKWEPEGSAEKGAADSHEPVLDETVAAAKRSHDMHSIDEAETSEVARSLTVESDGRSKVTAGHAGMDGSEPIFDGAMAPTKMADGTHLDRAATTNIADERKDGVNDSISEEDKSKLIDIFGEQVTLKILYLYDSIIAYPGKKPREFFSIQSDAITDRQKRTEAHVAIRRILDSKLETSTAQNGSGAITLKAAPPSGRSSWQRSGPDSQRTKEDGPRKNAKQQWSELGGEYLHFTLYKENKDTMEVMYFIASQLKMKVGAFQFAGTKDRRGVTVQKISVPRVRSEKFGSLNRQLRNSRTGGFEYHQHGLELGELTGNEFVITLRDCHFPEENSLSAAKRIQLAEEVVAKAVTTFEHHGFLNYYGLQRFGSFTIGTDKVGMKMLRGDLEGAVNDILSFSSTFLPENQDPVNPSKISADDIYRAEALSMWRKTGHVAKALNRMPRRFQAETAMIRYLGATDKEYRRIQEKDWQGALMQIQRNLRLMYVHAYQSLVWNAAAGKRCELYSGKVVEGDLVIVGEKDDKVKQDEEELDDDGEVIVKPAADDSAASAGDKFVRARALTANEASSGKYDIFDVVLPQPGFDVIYPANAIGDFYKEFMGSEEGGKLDPHNMRRGWRDVSLSGGYRKLMARPLRAMEYEVKAYRKDDEQMVETDMERIQKHWWREKEQANGGAVSGPAMEDVKMDKGEPMGDKIAVVLKMQLGSSTYATMALRELTKGGAMAYKPDYQGGR